MSVLTRVKSLEQRNDRQEPDRAGSQWDYKAWAENATDAEIYMQVMQSSDDGLSLEDAAKWEHVGLRLLLIYLRDGYFAVKCVTSLIDHPEWFRGWVVPPPRQGWQLVPVGTKYSDPNGLRAAGDSFSEWANKRMIDQDGVTPKSLDDVVAWAWGKYKDRQNDQESDTETT